MQCTALPETWPSFRNRPLSLSMALETVHVSIFRSFSNSVLVSADLTTKSSFLRCNRCAVINKQIPSLLKGCDGMDSWRLSWGWSGSAGFFSVGIGSIAGLIGHFWKAKVGNFARLSKHVSTTREYHEHPTVSAAFPACP